MKRQKIIFNFLTTIAVGVILFANSAKAEADDAFNVKAFLNKTHLTVGVGYKIKETDMWFLNDQGEVYAMRRALTARVELYYQLTNHIRVGVTHHSQYSEGGPFNDRGEYAKTELFIDYTISIGELF